MKADIIKLLKITSYNFIINIVWFNITAKYTKFISVIFYHLRSLLWDNVYYVYLSVTAYTIVYLNQIFNVILEWKCIINITL